MYNSVLNVLKRRPVPLMCDILLYSASGEVFDFFLQQI